MGAPLEETTIINRCSGKEDTFRVSVQKRNVAGKIKEIRSVPHRYLYHGGNQTSVTSGFYM